jgi:hypothetical protein
MSRQHVGSCWVIRDPDGHPYDEHRDVHHSTRESAESEIVEIRQEAAAHEVCPGIWERLSRRSQEALARAQARLEQLQPIALGHLCTVITCDGCGAEVDDDRWEHVHFPSDVNDLSTYHWTNDGEMDRCGPCSQRGNTGVQQIATIPRSDIPVPLLQIVRQ